MGATAPGTASTTTSSSSRSDLERAEILYTSLLIQMAHGLAAAELPVTSPSARAYGRLYRSRIRPGVEPIPVSQYKGAGQQWTYR